MRDEDFSKPQIGVASSWNEITPCNLSLDRLAERAKDGVRAGGGFPLQFGTISVSDGIAMGHEGMRASLVSREVIADSVECVMHAERFDGMVLRRAHNREWRTSSSCRSRILVLGATQAPAPVPRSKYPCPDCR
jgi:dihydroxyacid dehydratase/phosphogluconate dehydratase